VPAPLRSRNLQAPAFAPEARRRNRAVLFAILFLSLFVRVVYVLQSQASPAFSQPSMDALYHLEWARAFAAGHEYLPGPFFRAPLYPWFLGMLLRVFGENLLAVRLVQAAIGTVSVGLVYLVGARAFDPRTGLLAALLSGLYWVTIYFEGDLLLPVLEVFLDLLAIWLSLRVDEKPSPGRAALAGAAFGVAALVRPNVLLFCPVMLLWVYLRARRPATALPAASRAGRLAPKGVAPPIAHGAAPLAFLVALVTPIAPVTAYNGLVGGDWVLISSQGGVNFWIGNNPASDGASAVVPGTRLDWWGGYNDSIRLAETEAGRKLLPSEVSRHYSSKAWAWIRSQPRAAFLLTLWKLRLFWTDWELSNNTSERFFAFRYGPILRALPLGFGALAPLALLGFCLSARSWRRVLPVWGFLPVYMVSVIAFFVCSRFRVPALQVMAVLAAHACWRLVEMVRSRALTPLLASVAFLAAALVQVESIPAAIDRSDSKALWELGVLEAQRGHDAAAIDHFRASIALKDKYSTAHKDLGNALRRLGRNREAEESLRRAVAIDPKNVLALSSLFDLLLAAGRREDARSIALQAVESSPVYAPARYDLGRYLFLEATELKKSGADAETVRARFEQALAELKRGGELATDAPSAFRCAFAAGRIQVELGRREEALAAFERALVAVPDPPLPPAPPTNAVNDDGSWWWQCQADLLSTLDALGRSEDARMRRADLKRRFPHDPRGAKINSVAGN
jgi:tetratricopeptide (TPR) repeat protein